MRCSNRKLLQKLGVRGTAILVPPVFLKLITKRLFMTSTNTNVVAKIAAVVAGLGLVAMSFASFAPAKAATDAEMQAQITQLLATIASLQAQLGGGSNASTAMLFTSDLTIGSTGPEVTSLQGWLIKKGFAIPAGATGYFGAQTASALAAYQASVAISPAAGYFGPITRAKVNAELGASGNTGTGNIPGNDGSLSGGAGSVDTYTLISGLNNEEVGEDEEDVEVAGLEIEVDDGSDIEVTAVRLVFNESDDAAEDGSDDIHQDFEDYASEVSIWLDGEEVARLDADEFNDDNDWTQTVSLDGAVIDAGDTADLTVAVSGGSKLDSGDEGDVWDVDFRQVRFADADGATISEDPTEDPREFSFVSFASASDAELKVSLTNGDDADDINESHIAEVDGSDDTNVEVLAFTLEAEGDSDLLVDEIPVLITAVEAGGTEWDDVGDIITEATLYMDGEEVGSENIPADTSETVTTVTFDDLDLTIDAGSEVEFTVEVTVISTGEALDNGDTVKAEITSTQRGNIDVEDESGERLASNERTGSASGEAVALYDAGIMVTLVSTDADVTNDGDASLSTSAQTGTFKVTFDVTAFGDDMRIDDDALEDTSPYTTVTQLSYSLSGTAAADPASASFTSSTGATHDTESFLVEEDQTERFTLTVAVVPTSSTFTNVKLEGLGWTAGSADAVGANIYTFNLDDFKTDDLYLTEYD